MCFNTRTLGWCCSHGGRQRHGSSRYKSAGQINSFLLSDAAARDELCGRVVTDMVKEFFDGHIGLVDILVGADIPTAAEHLRPWVVFFCLERLHNFPCGVISSKVSVCSCLQEPRHHFHVGSAKNKSHPRSCYNQHAEASFRELTVTATVVASVSEQHITTFRRFTSGRGVESIKPSLVPNPSSLS